MFEDDPTENGNSRAFDSLPKSSLPPDSESNFDLEQEYIYELRGRSRSKLGLSKHSDVFANKKSP